MASEGMVCWMGRASAGLQWHGPVSPSPRPPPFPLLPLARFGLGEAALMARQALWIPIYTTALFAADLAFDAITTATASTASAASRLPPKLRERSAKRTVAVTVGGTLALVLATWLPAQLRKLSSAAPAQDSNNYCSGDPIVLVAPFSDIGTGAISATLLVTAFLVLAAWRGLSSAPAHQEGEGGKQQRTASGREFLLICAHVLQWVCCPLVKAP